MPSPGVVEARDALELGESGVGPGSKALAIEQSAFQAGEEALAQGIVVAVADRTHRGSDRGLPALIANGHLGVLQSLAAVVDHRVGSVHSKRVMPRASVTSSLRRWLGMGQRFSGCGRNVRGRPSAGGRLPDRGHVIRAGHAPFNKRSYMSTKPGKLHPIGVFNPGQVSQVPDRSPNNYLTLKACEQYYAVNRTTISPTKLAVLPANLLCTAFNSAGSSNLDRNLKTSTWLIHMFGISANSTESWEA